MMDLASPTEATVPPDRRTRQRVLEAAAALLAHDGLRDDLLGRAASAAGCTLDRARVFFQRDEELVLAMYARLASELEARVLELPAGGVAERFLAVMRIKFDLAVSHRDAYAALTATLLDPRSELGVLNPQTEVIRNRVQGVIAAVVEGAADRPAQGAAALIRALYGLHLGLMLVWCQDRTPGTPAVQAALALVGDVLALAGPFLGMPEAAAAMSRLDGVLRPLLVADDEPALDEQAAGILRSVFQHRRLSPDAGSCADSPCEQCFTLHLPKVKYFLRSGRPIHFLLPAFPAKSPSRRKTLGPLPDKAEELALEFLERLAQGIREMYAPGARITICSDGHVFSDLVRVSDEDVSRYGNEIESLLGRQGCESLDMFSLGDLYEHVDRSEMRRRLTDDYAQSLEQVEERAHKFDHARLLVNGIQRFLFEEQADVQSGRSRTQLRQECRGLAYQVVQRSDAWGRLLADCFPTALRLSIHPQHPHAEKIGILLGPADDAWLTPWHGVAVLIAGSWKFMKRDEAETLEAQLVERDGRPMYFELGEGEAALPTRSPLSPAHAGERGRG